MENCSTKPERKVLVIGYGNPLRGDDGVGPFVASRLGGVAVHQLTPELAEQVAAADVAIFVDARADLPPGEVQICPLEDEGALTHQCSPAYLVHLARTVYGRSPEATLVGIGAQSFELGKPLSEAVRRAADEVERRLSRYGV